MQRARGGSRGEQPGHASPPPPKTTKLLYDTASGLIGLVSSNRFPPPKTAGWIRPCNRPAGGVKKHRWVTLLWNGGRSGPSELDGPRSIVEWMRWFIGLLSRHYGQFSYLHEGYCIRLTGRRRRSRNEFTNVEWGLSLPRGVVNYW